MMNNVKIGNVQLKFTGEGNEYFKITILGGLLCVITLGIYSFWLIRNQFNFLFGNISMEQDIRKANVKAIMTAGGVFKNAVSSLLLTVCTLGIGYPWVVIRNIQFSFRNISINGNIDWNSLEQIRSSSQSGAMGEELSMLVDAPSIFTGA
jgi:uncharacterized membrane protein YjgN (DUF898 family)